MEFAVKWVTASVMQSNYFCFMDFVLKAIIRNIFLAIIRNILSWQQLATNDLR